MSQNILLTLCLLFHFFAGTSLDALQSEKNEELKLLNLIKNQFDHIVSKNQEIKGQSTLVKPLDDGGPSFINSVYLITTNKGEELIIKIGNPVWEHYKTANEVSALNYLKHHSSIPVPAVIAFEKDAKHSLIGREYILMPRIKGKPLSSEIDRIYANKITYRKILDQLAEAIVELKKHEFSHIGNFAISDHTSKPKVDGIVDFAGYRIESPCQCFSEYAKHALKYYIHEMEILIEKGSPDTQIYNHYLPILKKLLESSTFEFLDQKNEKFVLSHQDFVMKNILVDDDKVTAILDWEWSGSTLMEVESMTGFDFLLNEEDRHYFAERLQSQGLHNFFAKPNSQRQLFYRLLGNVYTLVAFREWRDGKLEHTAKFLSQKLEQRKIRNNPEFDIQTFLNDVKSDLNQCILDFTSL